jgi:hypothetical protein
VWFQSIELPLGDYFSLFFNLVLNINKILVFMSYSMFLFGAFSLSVFYLFLYSLYAQEGGKRFELVISALLGMVLTN